MNLKKAASLMISLMLLINPLFGVLAEGDQTETVYISAPDDDGNPVVTEIVEGNITVEGNDSYSEIGAEASATGKDGTDDVSAALTVTGDVTVKNEYEQKSTNSYPDENGNEITNTYGGSATGVITTANDAEASATVEGKVNVESSGEGTGASADSSNDGSSTLNTGDITVASGNNEVNYSSSDGVYASGSDTKVDTGTINSSSESQNDSHANGIYVEEGNTIGSVHKESNVNDQNVSVSSDDIVVKATSEEGNAASNGVENSQYVSNTSNYYGGNTETKQIDSTAENTNVSVDGNVSSIADGANQATAAGVNSHQYASNLEDQQKVTQTASITVNGDVSAKATSDSYSNAEGVIVSVTEKSSNEKKPEVKQTTNIDVSGSIKAEATTKEGDLAYSYATGISVDSRSENADINVNVNGDISAKTQTVSGSVSSGIRTNDSKGGSTIDITVGGNISAESNATDIEKFTRTTGISADARENGETSVIVKGNVDVTSSGDAKESTYTETRYSPRGSSSDSSSETTNYTGKSNIEIGGNVTVSTSTDSLHGYAFGLNVAGIGNEQPTEKAESTDGQAEPTEYTADKRIDALGVMTSGVNSNVTVDGDIKVQVDAPFGYDYGVIASTENDGNVTIDVGGSIEVIANVDEGVAAGICANMNGTGELSISVGDGITASTTGIVTNLGENATGTVNINVTGDVTGEDGFGAEILSDGNDTDAVAKMVIDGTLSGGEAGVLVDPTITKDNLDITVWQVNLTEVNGENHAVVTSGEEGLEVTDETKAIEQDIRYIIKVEANSNGTVALEGTEKVDGYDTAKEGDNIVMKISANAGYHVSAAYNGNGEQVPLLKDAAGNYYVIVPRGGGVYLSARIDQDAVESNESDNERPAAKATVVQLTSKTEEPELTEETLPGEESSKPAISAEDTATISRYSSEQQVAIILTKVGLIDALTSSTIRIKDLAVKATDGITSDLSSLLVEETLTIDGEEHVWKVITLIENGKTVKYCFRQLEDGTWIYRKISE